MCIYMHAHIHIHAHICTVDPNSKKLSIMMISSRAKILD